MKKPHKGVEARRDIRVTSQYSADSGEVAIAVARGGFTGSGEVLYRITAETLAGAIEDRKELATIVNNLGLLVLAQLCRFDLADNLEGLPKALAKWGHVDTSKSVEDQNAEALAIAQRTIHSRHGMESTPGDGPDEPDCPCRGGAEQTICARVGCGFCKAAEAKHPGGFVDGAGGVQCMTCKEHE